MDNGVCSCILLALKFAQVGKRWGGSKLFLIETEEFVMIYTSVLSLASC